MSDLHSIALALGMPDRDPPNLRHYAPPPEVDTPKRANCDCCDERPGVRTMIVCGIETNVCGPCSGDDDDQYDDDPRVRSFEEVMQDETGQPAYGPL